jgi:protein O-mannosyl-transferase
VVHPTTVESVAWMSEIKNTLSLPFYLLALHCWLDLEEGKGRFRYTLTVLFYVAAMLSKTSVVMLPFVLLLISWWKRGHLRLIDWGRIIPFLFFAALMGVITQQDQSFNLADTATNSRSFPARIGQAGASTFFYLGRFFWPAGNTPTYPKWQVEPPGFWHLLMAVALAGGVVFLILFRRRRWAQMGILGFGFFLLNLAPVVGLANMVFYYVSWVADHFSYLPCLGLIGLSVAGYEFAVERLQPVGRSMAYGLLFLALFCCLIISRNYASMYKDAFTLSDYALRLNPHSLSARRIHAASLLAAGRDQESIKELRSIVRDDPEDGESQWTLAEALSDVPASQDEAEADFQKLRLLPGLTAMHHYVLAMHDMKVNRIQDAIEEYRLAIKMQPLYVDAHAGLGYALMLVPGRQDEAFAEYATALRIDPTDAFVHNNLGYVYTFMPDRLDDALTELQLAVTYRPNFVTAHNNLGNAWAKKGLWDHAIAEYQQAIKLDPGDPVAYRSVAFLYGRVFQRWPDAVKEYQTLVRIQPGNSANQTLLGDALACAGNYDEACKAYEEALRLDPNDTTASENLSLIRSRPLH